MSIPDEDGEERGEKGRKWGEVGSFVLNGGVDEVR
jgi:hypothetical protein